MASTWLRERLEESEDRVDPEEYVEALQYVRDRPRRRR